MSKVVGLTASAREYAVSVKIKLEIKMNPATINAPGNPTFSTRALTVRPAAALVKLVNPLIGENHFELWSGVKIDAMKDQY
jgi:hypothetical protein